jgi:sarcosine oxidase delta subunit
MTIPGHPGITPVQLSLNLAIAAESEIDGVGMGVLTNGTPFLTLRGLARMCGLPNSVIVRMTAQWQDSPLKPREARIRELVRDQGADDGVAFIGVMKNGVVHHAVPDAVCMAVLEYYAFEAKGDASEHAAKSYRTLARKGFRDFIYARVGYNPTGAADVAWKQFHDRVSLAYHTVPQGYFSIFKELADIFVMLIRKGANLGPKFVPDISVGIMWGRHWTSENLEVIYGERIKYEHNYPAYFPQSASNPQHPFCYPDDALGEFRKWVRKVYLVKQMPGYLNEKVKQGQLAPSVATAALEAFEPQKKIGLRR